MLFILITIAMFVLLWMLPPRLQKAKAPRAHIFVLLGLYLILMVSGTIAVFSMGNPDDPYFKASKLNITSTIIAVFTIVAIFLYGSVLFLLTNPNHKKLK